MGNLGIGVLIQQLGDNAETVETHNAAVGKTISSAVLTESDKLQLMFTDGTGIVFSDEGQSCCEHRYMRTDDKPEEFIGAKFLGAEIKEAPDAADEDNYGAHEVEFLEVKTDKGVFTMASHNEHNGYYGGFHIVARPG